MTDKYDPYDHELERVGQKGPLLEDIAQGYYEGEDYNNVPEFWQHAGISEQEFNAAQAMWVKNKFGERIHSVLHQGKP